MADPVASSAVALTSAGLTVFGVATGLNPWHMIAGSAGGLFSLSFHNTPQPLLGRFVANTSASLLASYVTPLAVEMLRIKAVVPKSDQRFDDWMILFWKRSFEAIAAGGGGGAGVPEFADNAAAISGGLAVGYVYRTGGALKIVI